MVRVESFGYASFKLHLSDGTTLDGISAGNGSNAENAKARDRLIAVLTGQLAVPS